MGIIMCSGMGKSSVLGILNAHCTFHLPGESSSSGVLQGKARFPLFTGEALSTLFFPIDWMQSCAKHFYFQLPGVPLLLHRSPQNLIGPQSSDLLVLASYSISSSYLSNYLFGTKNVVVELLALSLKNRIWIKNILLYIRPIFPLERKCQFYSPYSDCSESHQTLFFK